MESIMKVVIIGQSPAVVAAIKKFREGAYIYMELSGPGDMIHMLENFYKVHEAVIRYLTVKVEKKPVIKKAEAPVTAEAPAAAGAAAEGEVKKDEQQQQSTPTGAE